MESHILVPESKYSAWLPNKREDTLWLEFAGLTDIQAPAQIRAVTTTSCIFALVPVFSIMVILPVFSPVASWSMRMPTPTSSISPLFWPFGGFMMIQGAFVMIAQSTSAPTLLFNINGWTSSGSDALLFGSTRNSRRSLETDKVGVPLVLTADWGSLSMSQPTAPAIPASSNTHAINRPPAAPLLRTNVFSSRHVTPSLNLLRQWRVVSTQGFNFRVI